MSINVKSIAKKATVVAEIMENREKGNTAELIKAEKVFTINRCEMCLLPKDDGNGEERVYAYTVEEIPEKFYFAGFILKKIFDSILEECEGDYEEMYAIIKDQGLPVKYGEKKTKDGKRTVTTIEVV